MKYVIIEKGTDEIPIIFPNFIQHDFFSDRKIISAGYVDIYPDDNGFLIYHAYGKSISLGLQARKEDSELIERSMNFKI